MDCDINPDNPACAGDSGGNWWDGIVDIVMAIPTALGKIIDGIIGLPKLIIDGIAGFFGTLFGLIGDIIDFIVALPGKIIDLLSDLLKLLFVPSDDFWDEQIGMLQDTLGSKLGTDGLKRIVDSAQSAQAMTLSDLHMTLNGTDYKVMDFNGADKAMSMAHMLIRGVMLWALVKYSISCVYKLVRKDDLPTGE